MLRSRIFYLRLRNSVLKSEERERFFALAVRKSQRIFLLFTSKNTPPIIFLHDAPEGDTWMQFRADSTKHAVVSMNGHELFNTWRVCKSSSVANLFLWRHTQLPQIQSTSCQTSLIVRIKLLLTDSLSLVTTRDRRLQWKDRPEKAINFNANA